MGQLFTREFIQAIRSLRIVSRQVPAGGKSAEHRSKDMGSGMEFRDFRAYVPGDDLRRADWNLYRRSGRLFLRMFDEPEDLPVYILADMSDSMFFEAPPRADVARLMTAAVAAISLNQHDRTGIFPFGSDLVRPMRPLSGKHNLPRVLRYLEQLRPAGKTDIVRVVRKFRAMGLRRGLVVFVSDFFDGQGIDVITNALKSLRHSLLLIQIARESDASPDLDGELTLLDCESGDAIDLTVTPEAVARYRRSYDDFCNGLLAFAARRRAAHVRLDADRPLLTQLGDVFPDGVLIT